MTFFYIKVQRNRRSCYRKRGLLFEAKADDGPFTILLIEADQWPPVNQIRVSMTPYTLLDYSQDSAHSLWTFLASTASNGMSYEYNLTLTFECLGMRFNQTDAKNVFDVFKLAVCVELWIRTSDRCSKVTTLIRPHYRKTALLRHYCESEETLQQLYSYCPTKKEYMRSSLEPSDAHFTCTIETVHYCDNPNCKCYYFDQNELIRHQLTCVNREDFVPKVNYKFTRMSQYRAGEELLQTLGFKYIVEQYCSYDIETLCEQPTDHLSKRNQTLVSISVKKSWGSDSICLTRKNSEPGSGFELVTQFINYLDEAHYEYRNRFADFQRIRNRLDQFASKWGINKSYEVQAAMNLINDMERLRVVGFNSERYDVPELYPYLVTYFGNEHFDVIKRGAGKRLTRDILFETCF